MPPQAQEGYRRRSGASVSTGWNSFERAWSPPTRASDLEPQEPQRRGAKLKTSCAICSHVTVGFHRCPHQHSTLVTKAKGSLDRRFVVYVEEGEAVPSAVTRDEDEKTGKQTSCFGEEEKRF
ncbi:hypothetical protein HPP92_027179 [Vanilla planifolia]|uniref:Uncharacterized protein n=1 Tax=Vanilla planifolia TaxID=51239 RepID=A0A835P9T0_VANPL|nr:hypothetical protein HPP92_027179 [Vanilla planifolia]